MDKRQKDFSNYIGQKFGELTVTGIKTIGKIHYCECKCICGKSSILKPARLMSGKYKSCGHLEGWAMADPVKNKEMHDIQRNSDKPLASNKSTGHKYISYNREKNTYDFEINRSGKRHRKRFKKLSDAIDYKKQYLEDLKWQKQQHNEKNRFI